MTRLTLEQEQALTAFATALIDQHAASIAVPSYGAEQGFWFGGGSGARAADGRIYVSGRYRNPGDSRYGLGKGTRGLELAIFVSADDGRSFEKLISLSKEDLSRPGDEVISIEGSALRIDEKGVELFVSAERDRRYPKGYEEFQKPGTGVWSIDVLRAESVEGLQGARPEGVISSDSPSTLHCKDPVLLQDDDGTTNLFFCTHPFTWASSNSAVATRAAGRTDFGKPNFTLFPRGMSWDVAMTRITGFLRVPRTGLFASGPAVTLVFYDGGECLRPHETHPSAVRRPRGYSCEEIGGLAYFLDGDLSSIVRLSETQPLFWSPWGTGSSRYTSILAAGDEIHAFWEQSQRDSSQPLVATHMSVEQCGSLLSAASGKG